jgi:hypothetical protein
MYVYFVEEDTWSQIIDKMSQIQVHVHVLFIYKV